MAVVTKTVVVDSAKIKDSLAKLIAPTSPTLATAAKQDTAYENFMKRFPLYSLYSPLKAAVYQDEKSKGYAYIPGPTVGYALKQDTAKINSYFRMEKVKAVFPSKVKFMWGAKATLRGEAPNQVETFDLYAIKVTDRSGKAAMFGDIITDARSDFNAQSGGHPYISMTMTGGHGSFKYIVCSGTVHCKT
jgi:SecD/SecF fusion protein